MSETFSIRFATEGQSDAVQAFEALKLAELEAKQEASRLGTELRKLQRSGSASAEEIEETSRALIRAKQSAQQYGQQAAALNSTQQTQAQTVTEGGRKWGELAGALGNVGAVVGNLSPSMGRFGSIIGQVGSASTALSGSLGPVGVGIAAVTTAVGIAIPLIEEFGDDSDAATTDLDNMADAAKNAADEVRGLTLALARQARQRNIASFDATEESVGAEVGDLQTSRQRTEGQVAQMDREIAALRSQRQELEAERTRAGTSVRRGSAILQEQAEIEATIGRIETSRAAAERRISANLEREAELRSQQLGIVLEERLAEEDEQEENHERRRRARRQRADKWRANRLQEEQMERTEFFDAIRDAEALSFAQQQDQIRELYEFWQELDNETIDRVLANRQRLADKESERRAADKAAQIAKAQSDKDRQNELAQITEGAWTSVGQSLQQGLGQAFQFIQEGNEATGEGFLRLLDSFLESIAIEYTIKAVAATGDAIGAFASYQYDRGGQYLAAAGIYAAVAGLAGGAAAAIPNASQAQPTSTAVQPTAPLGSGGGVNITQNLFAPESVHTERERGEIWASGVRAARREFGPGAARI